MKQFYADKNLNEVANEVIKYMPSLEAFYQSKETLSEYSKRVNLYKPNKIHLERQSRFKQKLNEKIGRLFTKQELSDMKLNINNEWGVIGGIVDHHGILDHPWLLAVHLVSNFYKLLHRDTEGDILTFATGNVPLNEPFRRRGFLLNGKKINLFPRNDKDKVVFGLPKYEFDFVNRLKTESHQWHTFTPKEQEVLEKIQSVIKNIDFSTCQYLGDQLTKINYYIWPYLFEEKLRGNVARFVSIEYDDLVIDYLVYVLKNEPNSFIFKMLFNDLFREKVLQKFEGAVGAWNEDGGSGTHFFWGLDEKNEHVRLELHNNFLVSNEDDFKIELSPEVICEKLLEKKLLPCMLLKFSLIIFYMGMKPLAGYSLEYLTRMKQKIVEVLKEDFPIDAKLASLVPLDNMNLASICQGRNEHGDLKELHAFDIFYRNGFNEEYFKKLDSHPFNEFMVPPLLFAYNYGRNKYGNQDKKKEFIITEADLQKNIEKLF
ncbi:MAG: hypothetical protein WCK11_00760 [Candidatus Falkowbacteria bacterium]